MLVSPLEATDVLGAVHSRMRGGWPSDCDQARQARQPAGRAWKQAIAVTRNCALLCALCLALAGCGRGHDVTSESLLSARKAWQKANLENYNLEWTSTGASRGHYRVFVRDGKVKRVISVLPNGKQVEVHPAQPKFYSVDGLLQVIEDELAQLKADRPFNQPKGTKTVLWFSADPELGYPRKYRRDVLGTPQGESIDVIRLDKTTADAAVPQPD